MTNAVRNAKMLPSYFFNLLIFLNVFQYDSDFTVAFPTKKGSKAGLYKSQIGLNISISQNLFQNGKIRIKCVGSVQDGILRVRLRD